MRFLCVLVGYIFGCFLTAEAVMRCKTGRSAGSVGSGNPGTANVASQLGLKSGALVLLGDIGKTALACLLCRFALFPALGQTGILYAGVGAALGHGFPFWNRFHGGKSVAVTCTYVFLFSPLWGLCADTAGLIAALATGYLAVGALTIPVLLVPFAFRLGGAEAGCVMLAGTALLFWLHRDSLCRLFRHTEKKTHFFTVHKKG